MNADPDIPILIKAKEEDAAIMGSGSGSLWYRGRKNEKADDDPF